MTTHLEWGTIRVQGPDAQSFLDGQLSQAVESPCDGVWTLVLEPSGVVLSAAWLRGEDNEWELLVPLLLTEAVVTRLNRFRIRVACSVEDGGSGSQPPFETSDERFALRWPWNTEFAADLPPHSFGQSFVEKTVSFTKGCFTGQEMVGRADARGATMPWRLVYATGPTVESIDTVLRSLGPEGPKGVTSTHTVGDQTHALGFAHRSLLATPLASPDVTIEEVL
jgi:folate-binding Fe-S cluster repair protein YgfZ